MSKTNQDANRLPGYALASDFACSAAELEPITQFASEKTYDIVVVGAGTAGVPAVLTALEEGATVCCLQKESTPISQGNGSSGVILEDSTEIGVLRWIQGIRVRNNFRVNNKLFRFFAYHSGETVCWLDKLAEEVGYPAVQHSTATSIQYGDGERVALAGHQFGFKPEGNHQLICKLAKLAEARGAEFFYKTPGVQLVKENGRITGVIGKAEDGSYIKFNANTAVILATVDYSNNDSMVERYCGDIARFSRKQHGKTADGHLMAIAAGAHMVPPGHAKQAHDADAAGNGFAAIPLLALDANCNRFMNEQDISMPFWIDELRKLYNQPDPGIFYRFFDGNYQEYYPNAPAPEALQKYIPGAVDHPKDVFISRIGLHCCDTLDELADELGLDREKMKAAIARYNKLCASGRDPEFGKDAEWLKPIDTPPYWGIRQWVRVTCIDAGVEVDEHYQVVDENHKPIPGLFAVGTTGGDLCGNADWAMGAGVSSGHCFNAGRYATVYAITGDLAPSHPAHWSEVKHLYTDGIHDSTWSWQHK